jgi:hypothetical protein
VGLDIKSMSGVEGITVGVEGITVLVEDIKVKTVTRRAQV